ncbi:pleckstrin homology-like domain family B member 2 [Leguminivora glycinivorella]|uniref:pleckstrin homology-like domain family B member 2 n=1 Tax=Leguminivora glycinivorella TaxID=1035111 RepID=UPI00200D6CF6|nr:pleckstrin homology-like domain family B member 2 [Leguminivora glycinivorella]
MTVSERKLSHKQLVKLFVRNLKKNTLALKELKLTIDKKSEAARFDKIIDITSAVNDKLEIVTKLRNDIKIYKTVNTILTNHYIKETKNHENSMDGKIMKLETQIKESYDELKNIINNKMGEIKAGNDNVFIVGNDMRCKSYNQFYVRNEIYNSIIKKIDKLFCGMAYQDRIKEEEQKEAETARLEEILNMCAEYERQIASGLPITPTEKRPHNKIITNGSLPRSVAMNNPNFVQTSDGYYKFETSHNKNMSQSLPPQRNVSSYENIEPLTPDTIEHRGRMDEIGIPVFEDELSSPVLIRKLDKVNSPIGSPYENVYYNRGNLKPKSPNSQSPRTRIKTTFAHKNPIPSPQYFIFPTPPPVDNTKKPNFNIPNENKERTTTQKENTEKFSGIEKQLSLEEDIPMIDDADITNDIEQRHSTIVTEKDDLQRLNSNSESDEVFVNENTLTKNQSFDDVKKELMADIPELEEFEKDLEQNKREKMMKQIQDGLKQIDIEADSIDSNLDVNMSDLKSKCDSLKEERKKLVAKIHELKCKMSEIRSQEDDILRELEMEKALIKGEYDSEIAILNIEQRKKMELAENAKKIEEDIKQLKEKQEARQKELKERVDIATMKVEWIKKDLDNGATVEELQNAQDILDNETKIFEDLEFQHLEEESELLANREDLQNEIIQLTKKIEAQKTRILTLKSEANSNLTSALDETKILQAEYVRLLNEVEELTGKVQTVEKELKPMVAKLNELERTQSPDSAFYTDQTRAKSGEFGYSPQSSDSDDLDVKVTQFEEHTNILKDKFNSIDQMSQSMIVDIERRVCDEDSESPSKSSTSKEKKGFWERNFDSLKRKSKKKDKDIMSQSLNENMFYNNDTIENDVALDRFNSLRHSKGKNGPVKSASSSKIPTFAALGKIIKKDSFKKSKEVKVEIKDEEPKNRYVKNAKPSFDNKYKAKSLSPDKLMKEDDIKEEDEEQKTEDKNNKVLHRKSCGDEPSVREFSRISESGKVPSQDDIDRISKVTMDAPILSSDTDMNSLGKRTLDSLMEIERKRMEMLEEQGCQVIENEREKISELKRRVQDETKKLWDQRTRNEQSKSFDSDCHSVEVDHTTAMDDSYNITNVFDESSGFMSSSIEELQVRNSRAESTEDEKRSDDSRPLSLASDFSRDNILPLQSGPRRNRRCVAPYSASQRPLTRYLPVDREDFDLRRHVESAGHQIELCPHVTVTASACRGYLHKLGAKFHTWSKRWFVFDRESKTFVYYWDKSERKPRGGAYFQVIEEVYLDHGNTSKSPNPQTTFIVKTRQRRYYLMAPSGEAARIWIDVVFTGAQGYTDYLD